MLSALLSCVLCCVCVCVRERERERERERKRVRETRGQRMGDSWLTD
jgi:hypothetical protein